MILVSARTILTQFPRVRPDVSSVVIYIFPTGVEIRSSQLGTNGTKVEKLGVNFMTSFKVMVVKTKFIVAKYD